MLPMKNNVMINIERILVPVDFSEHSARALAHARAFAVLHNASLELVHVIEEPTFPAFYSAAYAAAYGEAPANLEEAAQAALERLTQEVKGGDVERGLGYYVRRGHAAAEIIHLAREHDIDLIVIGSQGLSGVDHLMLGSVAEKVVRGAPCPVYVAKDSKASQAEPDVAANEEEWLATSDQSADAATEATT